MKFQHLQYFEDVCKTQSFTKTAENFFVSQPVISTAIKKLELEFGVNLLERRKFNNNFIITENGYELLKFIESLKIYEKEFKEKIKDEDRKFKIRLGIPPLFNHPILNKVSKILFNNLFDSDFENNLLLEGNVEEIHEMLINDKIDICISYYLEEKIPVKNIEMYKLKSIDFNIFANIKKTIKLNKEGIFDLQNLNNETIICLKKSTYHYVVLQSIIKKYKIIPKKIIYVEDFQIIETLVENNLGISFLAAESIINNSNIYSAKTNFDYSFELFYEVRKGKKMNSVYKKILKEIKEELK